MEIQTKEELKMAELAKYAIDTYGINGIRKYNAICTDLRCAKRTILTTLRSAIDEA